MKEESAELLRRLRSAGTASSLVADVRSLLGDDFAEEVRTGFNSIDPEKMAEVAATLPRGDAALLDSLMSDAGLRPTMSKAASIKKSKADWAKLAASHQ